MYGHGRSGCLWRIIRYEFGHPGITSSGFTCREMAEVLGVKTDSLYVLISRAKAQFEKEYVSLYGRAE